MTGLTKTEYSRIIQKRTTHPGVTPTINTASTIDDSWIYTDIFEAELFANLPDNKLYTRFANNIFEITMVPTGSSLYDIYLPLTGGTVSGLTTFQSDVTFEQTIDVAGESLIKDITQKHSNFTVTTDAATTPVKTLTSLAGRTTYQVQANITAIKTDWSKGLSAKMLSTFRVDGSGVVTQIGFTNYEINTEFTGAKTSITTDGSNIFVNVKGEFGTTINWKTSVIINK